MTKLDGKRKHASSGTTVNIPAGRHIVTYYSERAKQVMESGGFGNLGSNYEMEQTVDFIAGKSYVLGYQIRTDGSETKAPGIAVKP